MEKYSLLNKQFDEVGEDTYASYVRSTSDAPSKSSAGTNTRAFGAAGSVLTGVGIFGSMFGTQKAAEAQQEALLHSGQDDLKKAERLLDLSDQLKQNVQRKSDQVKGTQRVQAAASGLDVTTGAPVSAIADTIVKTLRDIENIETETHMQVLNLRNSHKAKREAARDVGKAADIKNLTTLLSFGTSAIGSTGIKE